MIGAVVRRARPDDAAALLKLQLELDAETRMMLEPGERPADAAIIATKLAALAALPNSVVLVAGIGDELAGYVEAEGGSYLRNRHSATLVVGVRRRFAGRGLGRALMQAVIDWAESAGVNRLELTVMVHNTTAIALYRSLGFVEEGLRRRSLIVGGVAVDELAMARLR